MLRLFGLIFCIGLGGCASTAERRACLERDWYEVGRIDGSQGRPREINLQNYRAICGPSLTEHAELLYTNGRNAGLVEYCLPENAFELGRMGIEYSHVCSPTMEREFLNSYRRGQQARAEEMEKNSVQTQ